MASAIDRLMQLQEAMDQRIEEQAWGDFNPTVTESDGLLAVSYFGSDSNDLLEPLFETLCLPDVAEILGSLSFAGEDEGGNGVKDGDFASLLDRNVVFPRLHTLSIEVFDPENYNLPIVARMTLWIKSGYEEDGELAEWLDRAPNLRHLATPSAPDARFFQRPTHPLQSLRVDAGFDTQSFIGNLARSSCFPTLHSLDWGDFHETHLEDWQAQTTPYGDYEALFSSGACPPVVTFRNPYLTADEVAALETACSSRRPPVALTVIHERRSRR